MQQARGSVKPAKHVPGQWQLAQEAAVWGDSLVLFPRALACEAERFGFGRLGFPCSTPSATGLPRSLEEWWSLSLAALLHQSLLIVDVGLSGQAAYPRCL